MGLKTHAVTLVSIKSAQMVCVTRPRTPCVFLKLNNPFIVSESSANIHLGSTPTIQLGRSPILVDIYTISIFSSIIDRHSLPQMLNRENRTKIISSHFHSPSNL